MLLFTLTKLHVEFHILYYYFYTKKNKNQHKKHTTGMKYQEN